MSSSKATKTLWPPTKKGENASPKSRGNPLSCLKSIIPSILTFVVYFIATILFSVYLSQGAVKTKGLLDRPGTYIHTALEAIPEACKVLPIVMVLIGLLALAVAGLSSHKGSYCNKKPKRKKCTRVLNIVLCLVLVVLQVIWVMLTAGLLMPVAAIMGLHMMITVLEMTRTNLKDFYAMLLVSEEEYHLQGEKLKDLSAEGDELLTFYLVAFLSAFVIVICLTFFIMSSVANFTRLRCKRKQTSVFERYQPTLGNNNLSGIEESKPLRHDKSHK